MKRFIVALLVGGVFFGAVYGLASTLNVGFGTAATGNGDVASCGDVTGSTYILEGQSINFPDAGTVTVTGTPEDISQFKAVNIETDSGCDQINVFIEVKDGENGTGNTIFSGGCEVHANGGLGYDEDNGASNDNTYGCTVVSSTIDFVGDDTFPDVVDAESLVVTMT